MFCYLVLCIIDLRSFQSVIILFFNNKYEVAMNIKVLAVDDHLTVIEGLQSLIECEEGMEFVGGAEDGESALKMIDETKPDVVIMDVQLQGLRGYDLIKQISVESKVKVLALSGYDNPELISKMLRAGAKGYILKTTKLNNLLESIRIVADDRISLDPSLKHDYQFYISEPDKLDKLTIREREILKYFIVGYTEHNIANELGLSISAIKTHCSHIREKFGFKSSEELLLFAYENKKYLK